MHRAARPGTLPLDTDGAFAGVDLPPGRRVAADPEGTGTPSGDAVLWVARRPSDDLSAVMTALIAKFPETGIWPLALDALEGQDDRPWLAGELDPASSSRPDGHDPVAVLTAWWKAGYPGEEEDEDDTYAPFGRTFPGLALEPRSGSRRGVDLSEVEIGGRLGLVPVTRPADVPAALGWLGPVNFFGDMGLLSAVLRSWEDRFSAHVVGLGFDTLTLVVSRPPKTEREALAVAVEHAAVCSDSIQQGAGSIEAYAEEIQGSPVWTFWWD